MDGSHEVMFTRPAELAEKIVEASAELIFGVVGRMERTNRGLDISESTCM